MKKIIGQPHFLKEINIDKIEQLIFDKGPISKPEMAKISGLSLPTVNKLVKILEEQQKVKSVGLMGSSVGRKANAYVVNKQSGSLIVLYFKNDKFLCFITNMIGEIVYNRTVCHDGSSTNSAIDIICQTIKELIEASENKVKAIGIGVPGVVRKDNMISSIPNIPELEGINLKKIIEDIFEIETFIENDIKLTTVGYYHKNLKKKYSEVIYMYIGRGLGSGIIINKKLYKGFSSFSGELGYMKVESLPNFGDYSMRGGALEDRINFLKDQDRGGMGSTSEKIKDRISKLILSSIVNVVCVINPQAIVLGGELVTDELMEFIVANISKDIPLDNQPEFLHDHEGMKGIDGAINMCISNISSNIKVINEKGV